MKFPSVEHRILRSYIDTFPPFVSLQNAEASEEAQRQTYDFFSGMYASLYDDPSALFSELHDDDAYPNRFNKSSYGKPQLAVTMRKAMKTMDGFLQLLFDRAMDELPEDGGLKLGDAKKARKLFPMLEKTGFMISDGELYHSGFPGMFPAWRMLAVRPGATLLSFSRCLFDPEYPYMSRVFRRLSGDEKAFDQLEGYLQRNGYRYAELREGKPNCDMIKSRSGVNGLPGNPVFDKEYFGLSMEYEPIVEPPQCFGLRVPGMREIIPLFEKMDDVSKEFIISYNHRCTRCNYCIQRNKKKDPAPSLFAVEVQSGGETHSLCPLFPGFYYCFTQLDELIVKGMSAFLSFAAGMPAQTDEC